MFQTIRSRLIAGVISLVFMIQIFSSAIQNYQTRSIFFDALRSEAKAVTLPSMIELGAKLDRQPKENIDDVLDIAEIVISTFGFTRFAPLVKGHDQLKEMLFVSDQGNIMAHNNENNNAEKIPTNLIQLVTEKKLDIFETENDVFVFVPYEYKPKKSEQSYYLGGILLLYTSDSLKNQRNLLLLSSLGSLVFFVILSAIVAFIISSTITSPIRNVSNGLKDISHGDGDLTQRIEYLSKGEVGRLAYYFNEFIKRIHQTISEVKTNANQLAVASEELRVTSIEINKTSLEIADGSEVEARSLSDTKKTLDTILATNQEITDHVSSIQRMASQAQQDALLGKEKIISHVTELSLQMNLLVTNNDSQNSRVQDIGNEIQNIDAISQNNARSTQQFSVIFKEVSVTTENIARMAEELSDQVGSFQT